MNPFQFWPKVRLEFGDWKLWTKRGEIENDDRPGVYCLGIGRRLKTFDWRYVRYIGVTTSKGGCKHRWAQLDRTLRGGSGHSGGRSMVKDVGLLADDASMFKETRSRQLFVSAVLAPRSSGTEPSGIRTHGIVRYLEFEAFACFAEFHARRGRKGRKPKYNSQWPSFEDEKIREDASMMAVKAMQRNARKRAAPATSRA